MNESSTDRHAVLRACTESFGAPDERRIGMLRYWTYLRIERPPNAREIRTLFDRERLLLRSGYFTWGYVTHVDRGAFERGTDYFTARVLFSLRTGDPPRDDSMRIVAEALAKFPIDAAPVFGETVPPEIAGTEPLVTSTIFVCRRHLPLHRLRRWDIPILASYDEPHVAMVVPSKFWPEWFVSDWVGRGGS